VAPAVLEAFRVRIRIRAREKVSALRETIAPITFQLGSVVLAAQREQHSLPPSCFVLDAHQTPLRSTDSSAWPMRKRPKLEEPINMPSRSSTLRPLPGLEVVGHGVYLRPTHPYALKPVLFERKQSVPYYSAETGQQYAVPADYEVDDSPPMPAMQALNRLIIEESWDRFHNQTSLNASLAVGTAPFSININASQAAQLRQEEDSYYAMRTSFIPLWAVYIPTTPLLSPSDYDADVPTPFSHKHRQAYARFFERYGTHFIKRAWIGGKATLAITVRKSSQLTKDEIQAGIQASLTGLGSAGVGIGDQRSRERLLSHSQCTVFGKGGDELKLAALSTLDDARYNEWLATVSSNPQLVELEAVGIWTLLSDQSHAEALRQAYREETLIPPLRAVFNIDGRIHLFDDVYCYTYDQDKEETSTPRKIREEWPQLFDVGFERVDATFLGKYLVSPEGEDLGRKLFIFNRDKYVRWDLTSNAIDPGYPRRIAEGWALASSASTPW
jgi:hypothetical protein